MEPESNLIDADNPALYQNVGGKFPIQRMMTLAKSNIPFNLTMKGIKVAGGAKANHQIIEPKANGGGIIQFFVGASKWEINFSFDDLEMDEKKGIIIHGNKG